MLPKQQIAKLEQKYNLGEVSGQINYKQLVEDVFSGKLVEIPKLNLKNIEGVYGFLFLKIIKLVITMTP